MYICFINEWLFFLFHLLCLTILFFITATLSAHTQHGAELVPLLFSSFSLHHSFFCLAAYPFISLSLWWNTFSLLHPSLSLCHALSPPPISRALIPSRPLLSTLPPPRNTFCCKPALSLLIFTTNIHTHANAHTHIYAQQWAVSPLKSHKEHNKAPLSTNLLAMGNPRGCTSMLETKTLTYLDTCTHMLFIHAKINLPACVSV